MSLLKFTDTNLVEQCRERQPEAENDIEAVDLTAQDIYKQIQKEFEAGKTSHDLSEEIALYGHLQYIREELNNNQIHNLSSYEVEGTGHG